MLDNEDAAVGDLTPAVIAHSITNLESNVLRNGDAIRIGAAVVLQDHIFVSADTRQLAAARKAGLRVEAV